MRGDSLRDLYAKSLALMGLALLGALGAAVDYWPGALTVPRTVAIDLGAAVLQPLSALAAATEPALLATSSTSVVVTGRAPATVALSVAEPLESGAGAEPEPQAMPPVDLSMQAPAEFTGIPATAIDLSAIEAPLETFRVTTIAPEVPGHQGFLAGITSPIVGATAKAGSVIGEGLVQVGGAVGGAVGAVGAGAKKLFGRLGLF